MGQCYLHQARKISDSNLFTAHKPLQVSSCFILTFETDPKKYARAVWKHLLWSGKENIVGFT